VARGGGTHQYRQPGNQLGLDDEVGEARAAELIDQRRRFGQACAQVVLGAARDRKVEQQQRDARRSDDEQGARQEDPVRQRREQRHGSRSTMKSASVVAPADTRTVREAASPSSLQTASEYWPDGTSAIS